jgi:hypothetical protein
MIRRDKNEENQTNNSLFLSLPPELRLQIYDYLYSDQLPYHYSFKIFRSHSISRSHTPTGHAGTAAHLRTCRQINDEATPIFYSRIPFLLSIFGVLRSRLPPSAHYSSLRACPTFSNIRNLRIILYAANARDVDCVLNRLSSALKLLDGGRRLRECRVEFFLYGEKPKISYATAALAVVKRIIELERRGGLNVVECQVYSLLWTDVVSRSRRERVWCRNDDEETYRQVCEEFEGFLKRVGAGEKRAVRNLQKMYNLRYGRLVCCKSYQEARRFVKKVKTGGR